MQWGGRPRRLMQAGGDSMATTATEHTRQPAAEASLRWGSWLMGIAAVGFIGYAVIFLVRNFTDSFLELGIGPDEVHVGKDDIQQFSPFAVPLRQPPTHRGVGVHRRY